MKKTRTGLTLLEALLSVTLFGIITYLMATLLSAASTSQLFQDNKDRVQDVALSCLYRMAHEARTANRWIAPMAGTDTRLSFETPDWEKESEEFPPTPDPSPTATPGVWVPGSAPFQMKVTYFLSGDHLVRRLEADGKTWETTLLDEVLSLTTHRDGSSGQIHISLKVNTPRGARTLQVGLSDPTRVWEPRS